MLLQKGLRVLGFAYVLHPRPKVHSWLPTPPLPTGSIKQCGKLRKVGFTGAAFTYSISAHSTIFWLSSIRGFFTIASPAARSKTQEHWHRLEAVRVFVKLDASRSH